ncbi:hypothetical protein Lal_00017796 [Lupinus albus]|nr:hypothetical protein Lal_00017796 [Lupinus albus]
MLWLVKNIHITIDVNGLDQHLLDHGDATQSELLQALLVEETFWKEKARIKWHSCGDRNTAFFHKMSRIRQATKAMYLIKNGDNILVEQEDITNHFLNYFTDLYASPNTTTSNNLIYSYQSWDSRLSEGFSSGRERLTWEGEILGYTEGFSPERGLSRLSEGVSPERELARLGEKYSTRRVKSWAIQKDSRLSESWLTWARKVTF